MSKNKSKAKFVKDRQIGKPPPADSVKKTVYEMRPRSLRLISRRLKSYESFYDYEESTSSKSKGKISKKNNKETKIKMKIKFEKGVTVDQLKKKREEETLLRKTR